VTTRPVSGDRSNRRTDTASRLIGASTHKIYQAFVQPASLMSWLPPSGMSGRVLEYDFREGGRYRIELRYEERVGAESGKTTSHTDITQGRFLELVPGQRIKQSVEFESSDPSFSGEMIMTWSFDPASEGSMVTVTADNVPVGISQEDHDAGLRSSLDHLADFVEHQH
jgi:uncharacterized protein YndB with AHSA1/START domain